MKTQRGNQQDQRKIRNVTTILEELTRDLRNLLIEEEDNICNESYAEKLFVLTQTSSRKEIILGSPTGIKERKLSYER